MARDFSSLIVTNETARSIASTNQDAYAGMAKSSGVASAEITFTPIKFGSTDNQVGLPYRRFTYNAEGRVIKKLDFDTNGDIEAKEESVYDKKDKWKVLHTTLITNEEVFTEVYEYITVNKKEKLSRYSFYNPKWPRAKTDVYEHDKLGRITRKTSYGWLDEPELITHYLYDSPKDTKVTYRYVTLPDESLVFTMMYGYDEQKDKQTGLYTFLLTPDEVTALRNEDSDWEMKSLSRSKWEYDAAGNNVLFEKDEAFSLALDMFINPLETAGENNSRILTEKTSREFVKLGNRFYLSKETEWLTRMNEPLKAVKTFTYSDAKGNPVFSGAES
ncbi:MAG: hypothetical protein JNM88_07585 [Chitinophagaceae bacterium]|nr:hypothetical protein [Chitinophagaceae bacterium]